MTNSFLINLLNFNYFFFIKKTHIDIAENQILVAIFKGACDIPSDSESRQYPLPPSLPSVSEKGSRVKRDFILFHFG